MTDATLPTSDVTCTRCERSLPVAAFRRDARRPSGTLAWCRVCERTIEAERKAARASAIRRVTFGVEVETVGLGREAVARAIADKIGGVARYEGGQYDAWSVTMTDGRKWNVMRDGSLGSGGGAEVVSPICKFEDMATVQEVVRAVRGAGARADERCGIHVHVGVDQLGAEGCTRLLRLVAAHEDTIVAMLGILPSRRHYCSTFASGAHLTPGTVERIVRTRPSTMDELAAAWYGSASNAGRRAMHYDDTRYNGLNLHSAFYRGTVEFRWFNGSLHAGKVRAYIMLALGLAAKAIAYRTLQTTERTAATRADATTLLDRLHVSGPDFDNCRKHLLAGFPEVA